MTDTTTAPVQTSTTTWNIDPAHSMAEFKVKHMMIANVKGQFSKVSGALFLDESDLANSRVEASIEAASIHTRDEQRDAHLKSPISLMWRNFRLCTLSPRALASSETESWRSKAI